MPKKRSSDKVSSIDVARLAGVSQAAVSRAFTPGASISDKMRRKVLAAAETLGYQPNIIARSLSGKATRLIGIVMVKIGDPFYARILAAFSRKLQEHGYWSLLINVNEDLALEEALPQALQYQVDGIVLTSATLSSPIAARCAELGVPVIMFNRYSLEVAVNSVGCDHARGAREVAEFLARGGHSRFGYIAGEANSSTNQERERGYMEGLADKGLSLTAREQGDYSYTSGFEAAGRLLERSERPDALFCANDWMAMAAMDRARQMGLTIPADLSVVGFDNTAMSGWPRYNLTTVNQPIDKLVGAAAEVLLSAIESSEEERVIKLIPGNLVIRSSARLPSDMGANA